MTSEEIAYVAGVLEGEGCFEHNRNESKYLRIRMETTDRDVADRLQSVTGYGTIFEPKKRQPHHKQSYMYSISTTAQALEVMLAVRPWMSSRRTAKIDALIAAYEASS